MDVQTLQVIFFIVGLIVALMLAFKEIYDIADVVGILNVLPGHRQRKQIEEEERLLKVLKAYEEILLENEERRVESLLVAAGIVNKRYLVSLRQAVEFINAIPVRSRDAYQEQLKHLIAGFARDQDEIPKEKLVLYPNVRFYIDFQDAAMSSVYAEKLAEILQALIANVVRELKSDPNRAISFDRIVVPRGGNVFLGLQLAERLRKPLVVLTSQSRRRSDCLWIGDLSPGERVIMINDVAVTGESLVDGASIIRVAGQAEVRDAFVLVERSDWDARRVLAECSEPLCLHSMVKIADEDIEKLVHAVLPPGQTRAPELLKRSRSATPPVLQ